MKSSNDRRFGWPMDTYRIVKRWVATRMPGLYSVITKTYDQLIVEYKALRRIGLSYFVPEGLGDGRRWQAVLPIQPPGRVTISAADLGTWQDLVAQLRQQGLPYSEGGHTVYLPPRTARRSVFSGALGRYPPGVGIKILKHPGSPSEAHYVHPKFLSVRGESRIQYGLTHTRPHLVLVANLLHAEGLAPRLFDLLEIECGSTLWTAYVVEHVEGREPSLEECRAGVNAIRRLEERGLLRNILPDGFDDPEFTCPGCQNNAIMSPAGKFSYMDFQNFRLVKYHRYLRTLVQEAAKVSHFGDLTVVRGGRYLYQPIPGVGARAKRDTQVRMEAILGLLATAGLSVEGRLVLDVGCNIGAMMAEYLKLGASWCHGWDRPQVVAYTERVLLALGCTRFSTTGRDLRRDDPIEGDIPEFVRADLEGCVISYLAVRAHLGWLGALPRIPWIFMIYEGHEEESRQDFHRHVKELNSFVPVRVAGVSSYADGDCAARVVALLVRDFGESTREVSA